MPCPEGSRSSRNRNRASTSRRLMSVISTDRVVPARSSTCAVPPSTDMPSGRADIDRCRPRQATSHAATSREKPSRTTNVREGDAPRLPSGATSATPRSITSTSTRTPRQSTDARSLGRFAASALLLGRGSRAPGTSAVDPRPPARPAVWGADVRTARLRQPGYLDGSRPVALRPRLTTGVLVRVRAWHDRLDQAP